ncbi:MAG: hypothetical protein KDD25_04120 [Bdellovibrionales bacterium]|nr:hypothetical protein [Bdellovibrionales bacterium]
MKTIFNTLLLGTLAISIVNCAPKKKSEPTKVTIRDQGEKGGADSNELENNLSKGIAGKGKTKENKERSDWIRTHLVGISAYVDTNANPHRGYLSVVFADENKIAMAYSQIIELKRSEKNLIVGESDEGGFQSRMVCTDPTCHNVAVQVTPVIENKGELVALENRSFFAQITSLETRPSSDLEMALDKSELEDAQKLSVDLLTSDIRVTQAEVYMPGRSLKFVGLSLGGVVLMKPSQAAACSYCDIKNLLGLKTEAAQKVLAEVAAPKRIDYTQNSRSDDIVEIAFGESSSVKIALLIEKPEASKDAAVFKDKDILEFLKK